MCSLKKRKAAPMSHQRIVRMRLLIGDERDEEFYQEAGRFIMGSISTIGCYFIIDISNETIEMIIAHIATILSRNH